MLKVPESDASDIYFPGSIINVDSFLFFILFFHLNMPLSFHFSFICNKINAPSTLKRNADSIATKIFPFYVKYWKASLN